MMIKANGEYLDFNGDIEIDSSIKLFDQIDKSSGEFSYDLDFADNGHNRKILGIPRADTVKRIYQIVPSEVIDDTGQSIYTGKLQVNRIEGGRIISTFFSGNADWFSLLSEPLASLPLYRYDTDLTEANIQASWLNESGLVFPILDTGVLVTRSFSNLKIEDFTSAFYVKTLFNEIFNPQGIKVQGDLIDDPIFKKLVVCSNGKSQDDVDARSSYVEKTAAQNGIGAVDTIVTFQDETTFPFFDGSQNNYDIAISRYTADVRMILDVDVDLFFSAVSGGPNLSGFDFYLHKNGVFIPGTFGNFVVNTTGGSLNQSASIPLDAGDYIDVVVRVTAFNNLNVRDGTVKFTPTYIYRVFGNSSVPNWTQLEFVSNILRIFNVLPSFNTNTQTLTLDLFNKIKEKEYVDVSDEIVIVTTDFSEFVSGYAKNNIFKYQESEDEDLRKYNISNFISYGSGNLTIDNDYIENSADIVESDFTSPITYLNGVFDMSMERFNFVDYDEGEDLNISNVTDSSGTPLFFIADADTNFIVGDGVRLNTTVPGYNGEFVINAVASNNIAVNGLMYSSAATGTANRLRHQFTTDDNVYLFVNIPNITVPTFSSKTEFTLEDATTFSTAGIAYFNMLSNGTAINKIYKQSLSFGAPNNLLNYQLTALDTYWPLFSRVLNDPVMLLATGYFKRKTYDEIKTFLRPLMVKTEETVNLYYMNRLIGYKGSERGGETQLIKLN